MQVLAEFLSTAGGVGVEMNLGDARSPRGVRRLARQGTDGDQYVDPRGRGALARFAMQRAFDRAELEHVPHHEDLAPVGLGRLHRLEHRGQGRRAAVVGVVDDDQPAIEVVHSSASLAGLELFHLLHRRLELLAGGNEAGTCRDGVERRMPAAELELHLVPSLLMTNRQAGPPQEIAADLFEMQIGLGGHAESDPRAGVPGGLDTDLRVIDVDHRGRVVAKNREQFALRRGDVVEGVEVLQVHRPDVCHQADVGIGHLRQFRDLAGGTHRQFEHDVLGVSRTGQQGERHAEVVVEVAQGAVNLVSGRQAGGEELLRRRLAIAAGDRQPARRCDVAAQPAAASTHRRACVVDLDHPRRCSFGVTELPGDHRHLGPALGRVGEEAMAVGPRALEGEERPTGSQHPRVDHVRIDAVLGVASHERAAGRLGELGQGQFRHGFLRTRHTPAPRRRRRGRPAVASFRPG